MNIYVALVDGLNAGKTKVYQMKSATNYSTALDGTNISTETAFNPSATFASNAFGCGLTYSTTAGYISGGWKNTSDYLVPSTSCVRYATDTTEVLGNSATAHLYGGRGVNFSDAGYTGGGSNATNGATVYNFIQKIAFSTDVISFVADAMSITKALSAGVTDYINGIGYFVGGYIGGSSSTADIQKFIKATETSNTDGIGLDVQIYWTGGMETGATGYTCGTGAFGTSTSVRKLSFATGGVSIAAFTVPTADSSSTAGGSNDKFFIYRASTGTGPIDRLLPATDTYSTSSIALSEARYAPNPANA